MICVSLGAELCYESSRPLNLSNRHSKLLSFAPFSSNLGCGPSGLPDPDHGYAGLVRGFGAKPPATSMSARRHKILVS